MLRVVPSAGSGAERVPSMQNFLGVWFEFLLHYWQEASPMHYGVLVTLIVVIGWLTSQYSSR